jgi:hypothetical protein
MVLDAEGFDFDKISEVVCVYVGDSSPYIQLSWSCAMLIRFLALRPLCLVELKVNNLNTVHSLHISGGETENNLILRI